jgi:hypothetical protein
MTKAEYTVIKRYASNVIAEHGGLLQAYAYIEYVLMKIEMSIFQNHIVDKLMDEYEFFCTILDELECRIYMN